ncbi:MAG: hypothetical protein JNL60_03810 [Bacteroidia bacterium]|nr:hypothetical protein [Bacteroidia bacterium]
MVTSFSYSAFFKELQSTLVKSNAELRKKWASTIVEKDIDLKKLSELLKAERKTAIRFLWFLTEIGMMNPDKLFEALPFLLTRCDKLDPAYKQSFASYWLIAGIPKEQEARAIDLCFGWLVSANTNVTIKSRAIWVLLKLAKKYPELKNELKLCIKDQMNKYSKDFEKRAVKVLKQLED